MEPSRYEKDILKQLTRIANALENINNKTENMNKEMHVSPDGTLTVKPIDKLTKRRCPFCLGTGIVQNKRCTYCYGRGEIDDD